MPNVIPIFAQDPSQISSLEAFGLVTIFATVFIFGFLFYVIPLAFMYKKAGKPAWAPIVPFYNIYVHAQIIGRNPIIILLLPIGLAMLTFVPIVNIAAGPISFFIGALIWYETALVFGQSQGVAIANVFFNSFINFYLAFSSNAQYQGPLAATEHRVLLEAPWLDPALGVQGINPYAPQVYGATGHYDPNAVGTYRPMGYNPTGAPIPGQPPLGTQPGMPSQPPVAGQPGVSGVPTVTPQANVPPSPPAQPPTAGGGDVITSAADWGPAPEGFSQPPATPAPGSPLLTDTDEGDTSNPFGS